MKPREALAASEPPEGLTERQRHILSLMDAEHLVPLSRPFVKALRTRGLHLRAVRLPDGAKGYYIPMPQPGDE